MFYNGMAPWGGYGMTFAGNFLHHSLEVPGLHGRGGTISSAQLRGSNSVAHVGSDPSVLKLRDADRS